MNKRTLQSTKNIDNLVIKIFHYPSDEIISVIAQKHGTVCDRVISGLTNVVSSAHFRSDYFCTVMYNEYEDVIGYASFIKSSKNDSEWFYSDLWIDLHYRLRGYSKRIVKTGLEYLSELDAKVLFCTVDPSNTASLCVQRSLGFTQIETQPFEDFDVDGFIMFKINISHKYNIVPAKDDFNHVLFIRDLIVDRDKLASLSQSERTHMNKEIQETLIVSPPKGEKSFIVRRGIMPVAWLKLNVLVGKDVAWINALVVHGKYRNRGAGKFAVQYAEEYLKNNNYSEVKLHIAYDNVSAIMFYQKMGYEVEKIKDMLFDVGENGKQITFAKKLH